MARKSLRLLAGLLATCALAPAGAIDLSRFVDPEDGQLDLSDWLTEGKGFLPVPIIVTEPAVGFGAGLAALFVRNPGRSTGDRVAPPDVYALGAVATENGTRAGFAGGMVGFDDDRWRWRGALVRTSANLDFYGIGGESQALRYNLDGWASVQQAMHRLGGSDAWIVARWNWLDLASRFDSGPAAAAAAGAGVRTDKASGLGLSVEFDSRDTIFTPSRGWTGAVEATWYDPRWGSDTRFQSYRGYAFAWWPVAPSLVLAGRADVRAADGQAPFYLLPSIDLRGVPALRLQDRRTAVVETEARWNLTPRWALVGFAGTGRAWGTIDGRSSDTVAAGAGVRYLIARKLGMYMGLDVARSTQDRAVYIQVGHAWR